MPSPLSMRLPDSDIAIIDCAAALRGRSRTDFVRDAAVRAADLGQVASLDDLVTGAQPGPIDVRAGSAEGPKVRNALATTKDFDAVTGRITLSAQRDAVKSAVILQVKGGKFVFLETVAP